VDEANRHTNLIFNSTGEGTVDVFHEDAPNQYSAVQRIATRAGAKTMALDFKTHRLFVPAAGSGQFEILGSATSVLLKEDLAEPAQAKTATLRYRRTRPRRIPRVTASVRLAAPSLPRIDAT